MVSIEDHVGSEVRLIRYRCNDSLLGTPRSDTPEGSFTREIQIHYLQDGHLVQVVSYRGYYSTFNKFRGYYTTFNKFLQTSPVVVTLRYRLCSYPIRLQKLIVIKRVQEYPTNNFFSLYIFTIYIYIYTFGYNTIFFFHGDSFPSPSKDHKCK